MTQEQEALLNELKASDASYAQAKEVIHTMEGLSDSEKREALLSFVESDWELWRKLQKTKDSLEKPKITNLINLAPKLPASEPVKLTAARISQQAAAFLAKYKLIVWGIIWGLVIYFSYFALWAIARYLERLIMRI